MISLVLILTLCSPFPKPNVDAIGGRQDNLRLKLLLAVGPELVDSFEMLQDPHNRVAH